MTDFLQNHPDGVILALDEMSLYFQATRTRVWSPVGQTAIVAVQPGRECCHFYGALNLRTGREIAARATEQTSQMTTNFVMPLLLIYTQPILLLLDRAAWHDGALTQLIDATDRLEIMRFPVTYPDLNPQEPVWERTRDAVSHKHGDRSFEQWIDAFETHLNPTPFETNFMSKNAPAILYDF